MSQDLRRQALTRSTSSVLPSRPSSLRSSVSASSLPEEFEDGDEPQSSELPSPSNFRDPSMQAKSSMPSSSSKSRSIAPSSRGSKVPSSAVPSSAMPSPSQFRDPSQVPASIAPSASKVPGESKAPRSKVPSSQAPHESSKAPASSMPSSSEFRDQSQVPGSLRSSLSKLPVESSKVPRSSMPSLRDPSKVPSAPPSNRSKAPPAPMAPSSKAPRSMMPSPSSMRDPSKISGSMPPASQFRDESLQQAHSMAPLSDVEMKSFSSFRQSIKPGQSLLLDPEDIKMASRQSQFASLPPEEQKSQIKFVRTILAKSGSCLDKYPWKRVEEHQGYMCEAGRHSVPDWLIEEGKGGWFSLKVVGHPDKGMHGHYYGDPVAPSEAIRAKDGKKFSIPRKERDGPVPVNVEEPVQVPFEE